MGQKVAVVLSGCGFLDGAEVTESVSTLIALGQNQLEYECFAPELKTPAVNHLDGHQHNELPAQERCVRQEAARIARGQVQDLSQLKAENFKALVLPGGYGVAKHLCDFATQGAAARVLPTMQAVVQDFYKNEKPILAICIAPALVACVLGQKGVSVTIGKDPGTAEQIQKTGARHVECEVTDFVTDREHRIVSTPAYMYDGAKPSDVFTGIQKSVQELAGLA